MQPATREWVKKAEADYRAATREALARAHDLVCFLCQQCSEKYLKAILQERGRHIPFTHDLWNLVQLVAPLHPQVTSFGPRLRSLTDSAAKYRYPGASATARQARAALRIAREARVLLRGALGLK